LSEAPEDVPLGERARFAELTRIFARHGLSGLASRMGLIPGRSALPAEADAPERVVAMLRDLGPVAVKLGQVLATREDLLGPEWVAALSTLQDQVLPLPFEQIEDDLVAALGAPVEEVFARLTAIQSRRYRLLRSMPPRSTTGRRSWSRCDAPASPPGWMPTFGFCEGSRGWGSDARPS
jgi:hypothetical protein